MKRYNLHVIKLVADHMFRFHMAREEVIRYASMPFLNHRRRRSQKYFTRLMRYHGKAIADLVEAIHVNTSQTNYSFHQWKVQAYLKFLKFEELDRNVFANETHIVSVYEIEDSVRLLIQNKHLIVYYQGPVYSLSHVNFLLETLIFKDKDNLAAYIEGLPELFWEQEFITT